ncbi:CLUMA_CG018483, isoform A [Clunio marinus]|uniref:CLUMA_CG018483, isoform A n=1 Tax=Clunio marinus TaxID=568069 RepID=A0A1J1IYM1_9DIPT|nr:CLUMA_CG018483, isoform A [Clunio marinus]
MSMIKEKRGIQKCRLCRNHGIDVIRFGHSPCQFEQDHLDSFGEPCLDCKNTKERREKSAREIQRKRKFSCFLNEHCSSDETHGKQRKEKQCRKCRVHGVVSKFGKKHLEIKFMQQVQIHRMIKTWIEEVFWLSS